LNKSILDQGWFEFRRQLDYKLAWNGGRLMVVPPQNTSRTCPRCGHVSADNRQTQARFRCVACGFGENADMVGAINILSRGIQMLRDEGRDTINALIGMPVGNHLCVSPDGLWIEPHKRSEAGTRRSVSGAALCRA
jgi:putative transposase